MRTFTGEIAPLSRGARGRTPAVEYALTELGVDANELLAALRAWVERNIERFP